MRAPAPWLIGLGLIAGFLLPWAAPAQTTSNRWLTRAWQSDDGLPNNNITSLAQTPDGYLWIANPGYLARFDGVSFDTFRSADLFGPGAGQKVTSLLRDRSGALWLGMDHGAIVCVDDRKLRVFTNGVPDLIAWTLVEDDEGGIWIKYGGSTICRFKDGVVTRLSERNGLPVPAAGVSLVRDRRGRIWVGTAGKIVRYEGDHFVVVHDLGQPDQPIRLAAAADGLWLCAGLRVEKLGADEVLHDFGTLPADQPGAEPTELLEDHAHALWIGTSSSGLFRLGPDGFERVPTSHNKILGLLEDRENHLWVGTGGGGLNRIQPAAIQVESVQVGGQAIQSICESPDGAMWATTDNGALLRRDAAGWASVSNWPGGRATCVVSDRSGSVWIGTRNHQICRWRDGRFETGREWALPSLVTHALLAAANGALWIGGEVPETLHCLRDGTMRACVLPPNIRIIRAMTEDTAGNIWLGTSRGMLLRVTNDRVIDETARTTGEPLSIRVLHATADGSLWIGYVGGGIGRLKDGHFTRVSSPGGLYDDIISQLVSDQSGWLWAGCDHGIFKISRSELDAFADGKLPRVRSIHYGRDDGLPSLQASFGDAPGSLRGRDGRLWMPMLTGVAVISPQNLPAAASPPPVLLKRVTVDEQAVAAYGGGMPVPDAINLQQPQRRLRLPPTHHRMQFDFTAMTFNAAENVHFRYRLDGIDDQWIEAGAQRTASYSRLPAGDYRFEVTVCSGDGIWNETGARLAFSVAPFFWQTWWFRLAALAAFTLGAVGIGRYLSFRRLRLRLRELEQKTALDRERARIARDIHDDLGGSLTHTTLLVSLSQKNRGDAEKVGSYLKQVSANVREVVESLDEIVWAVNPGNDVLPHLVDYLGQFAADFLRAADLRCRIDFPENPPPLPVAPDVRHNLFLVVKETLNNIVRHARASEVRLELTLADEALRLTIEDDGCGAAEGAEGAFAHGLKNMRQRMSDLGGRCDIERHPGAGTRVTIFLPLRVTGGENDGR
jgi:signal transduction histidine kinase/ligand-binding sensor domain-containing protein